MSHKISHIICSACKKEEIVYISCNPAYTNFADDAVKLGEIYLQLKEISGELFDISQRHNIEGLSNGLFLDIGLIEEAEHDLLKLAHKIKDSKC